MDITGIYRHFKGNYYEVLGLAVDTQTGEELILYRQMYGSFGLWLRPRAMFFGTRQTENGPAVRFRRIGVSFESILQKADLSALTAAHSETEEIYQIVRQRPQTDPPVFEVKRKA